MPRVYRYAKNQPYWAHRRVDDEIFTESKTLADRGPYQFGRRRRFAPAKCQDTSLVEPPQQQSYECNKCGEDSQASAACFRGDELLR